MWHRLDRVLRRVGGRSGRGLDLCEACGAPLGRDPSVAIELPAGCESRICSPECLPSVWKKMVVGRQKLSLTDIDPDRPVE